MWTRCILPSIDVYKTIFTEPTSSEPAKPTFPRTLEGFGYKFNESEFGLLMVLEHLGPSRRRSTTTNWKWWAICFQCQRVWSTLQSGPLWGIRRGNIILTLFKNIPVYFLHTDHYRTCLWIARIWREAEKDSDPSRCPLFYIMWLTYVQSCIIPLINACLASLPMSWVCVCVLRLMSKITRLLPSSLKVMMPELLTSWWYWSMVVVLCELDNGQGGIFAWSLTTYKHHLLKGWSSMIV